MIFEWKDYEAVSLLMVLFSPSEMASLPPSSMLLSIISTVHCKFETLNSWLHFTFSGGSREKPSFYIRGSEEGDCYIHILAINPSLQEYYLENGYSMEVQASSDHKLTLKELFEHKDVMKPTNTPNPVHNYIEEVRPRLTEVELTPGGIRSLYLRLEMLALRLRWMSCAAEVWHHVCISVARLVPRILDVIEGKIAVGEDENTDEEVRMYCSELVREMSRLMELCELVPLEVVSLLDKHGHHGLIVGHHAAALRRLNQPSISAEELSWSQRIHISTNLLENVEQLGYNYIRNNRTRCIKHRCNTDRIVNSKGKIVKYNNRIWRRFSHTIPFKVLLHPPCDMVLVEMNGGKLLYLSICDPILDHVESSYIRNHRDIVSWCNLVPAAPLRKMLHTMCAKARNAHHLINFSIM